MFAIVERPSVERQIQRKEPEMSIVGTQCVVSDAVAGTLFAICNVDICVADLWFTVSERRHPSGLGNPDMAKKALGARRNSGSYPFYSM